MDESVPLYCAWRLDLVVDTHALGAFVSQVDQLGPPPFVPFWNRPAMLAAALGWSS